MFKLLMFIFILSHAFPLKAQDSGANTNAEKLIKLHEMLKSGVITQEQFDALKEDLLSKNNGESNRGKKSSQAINPNKDNLLIWEGEVDSNLVGRKFRYKDHKLKVIYHPWDSYRTTSGKIRNRYSPKAVFIAKFDLLGGTFQRKVVNGEIIIEEEGFRAIFYDLTKESAKFKVFKLRS